MTETLRVVLVEDHEIVRKGILGLLAVRPEIEVVGEAATGVEAVEVTIRTSPDVVVMDLLMPELDGVEAIKQILARRPDTRILVLTSFATDDRVFPAIKAGALGYLLKDSGPDTLLDAIRQVGRGESSLHPAIARKVLQELAGPQRGPKTPDPLTEREVEVLRLIARGMSNQGIARTMIITDATVKTHVSTILSKLHLASRTQAALYALREGLATLDDSAPVE